MACAVSRPAWRAALCDAGDNDHLQQLTKAVLDFLQQEEFELPSPQPTDSVLTP
jgi:hypothetical protein